MEAIHRERHSHSGIVEVNPQLCAPFVWLVLIVHWVTRRDGLTCSGMIPLLEPLLHSRCYLGLKKYVVLPKIRKC